jgi:hypothetical protein
MIGLIQESTCQLAKHYPLMGESEFELTINPSGYVRLCHELQMYARQRPGGPGPVPDVGWLHFDVGVVYISVSPLIAESDAFIEVVERSR